MDRIDERCAWQQCSEHLTTNHHDRWHSSGSLARPCVQVLCYSPRPTGLIPRLLLNPGNETQAYCSDKTTYCMVPSMADGIYVYDMMAKHKQVSLLRTYKQLWKWRNYSFQLVLGAKRLWFLKLWRTLTRIIYEWNTWKLNLRCFQIQYQVVRHKRVTNVQTLCDVMNGNPVAKHQDL